MLNTATGSFSCTATCSPIFNAKAVLPTDGRAFAQHPSWMAGGSTLRGAERHCGTIGFNGGRVALSQFPKKGFDANVAC